MQHDTQASAGVDPDEIDEIDVREIAAALRKDVRTVRKVLRGEKIRGIVAQAAIEREAAKRRHARGRS